MYRAVLRNLLANRSRLLMTMMAVILGTTFVSCTLVFSDSVARSLKTGLSTSFTGVTIQVTDKAVALDSGPRDRVSSAVPLTGATLRRVAALPGAASARGVVTGFAGLADPQGDLIGKRGSTHGSNWVPGADGRDSKYPMARGAGPSGPQEVAIDQRTAKKNNFHVGDTVRLAVTGPVLRMTLTGIFNTDDPQVRSGGSLVLFDTATAQRLYLKPGQYSAISALAKPGVNEGGLLREAETVIPASPNIEAKTITQLRADQATQIAETTLGLKIVLLAFAGIALFVGIFLISNTFTMLIGQRTRELALLRAIGASPRQVTRSVLLEALIVGASASVVGLVLGIGSGVVMQSAVGSLGGESVSGSVVVSATTVVAGLLTGILVTLAAALLPARRASRVPPVAALRNSDAPGPQKSLILRDAVGVVLSAIGVLAVVVGAGKGGDGALRTVGLGALFTMIGIFVLTPVLFRPLVALMGPLYGRLFGVTGSLARRNAIRNPRRTAATAAPLTLGVGLLSLLAIVGASMSSAIGRQVTEGLRADYEITTPVSQPLSPDVLPEIARVPGVAVSAGFDSQVLRWHSGSGPLSVYGVNPSVISQLIVPKMVSGSMAALDGGQLLIEQASATLEHLRVGSRIDVTYPDETKGQLTIGGIYQTSDIEGPSLLSETVLGRHTAAPYYSGILVKGSNGASAPLRQALKDATGANPLIQVETRQQLRKSYSSLITLILEITYGLLGMAVIIAVLGVVNTLALSIFERRREIGMLRAIGLNRRGVTRMIQLESVMIALLAAVLGVVVGTFLAWATVHVSKNSVSDLTTVWPYGTLAAFLLVAVLVGLIAAFWPARRATRLDILGSIQTD